MRNYELNKINFSTKNSSLVLSKFFLVKSFYINLFFMNLEAAFYIKFERLFY